MWKKKIKYLLTIQKKKIIEKKKLFKISTDVTNLINRHKIVITMFKLYG